MFLEIGAGYGGLAYHLSNFYPGSLYVIVDLPETLIFSASYITVCSSKSLYVFDKNDFGDVLKNNFLGYDFAFLPPSALSQMQNMKFDLAVNLASFQEMTHDQLEEYLNFLQKTLIGELYSNNEDKMSHNSSTTNVSQSLSKRFALEEIHKIDPLSPVATILSNPGKILDISPRKLFQYIFKSLKSSLKSSQGLPVRHEYICKKQISP